MVSDYLDMLTKELRQEPFSKAEHNRQLGSRLDARTKSSIERKHQNISAIMLEFGFPYIDGYKPLGNYQRLLREVVAARLGLDRSLRKTVARSVEASMNPRQVTSALLRLEPPPMPRETAIRSAEGRTSSHQRRRAPVNYLEREARNASVGLAGEQLVLQYERTRLIEAGCDALADRIEHVSVTEGDGAGFDIRSFETDGADRFIEVKTTQYGKETPFFVSRNELDVSRELAADYRLYRVFRLRQDPCLYTTRGSLSVAYRLMPELFSARVA